LKLGAVWRKAPLKKYVKDWTFQEPLSFQLEKGNGLKAFAGKRGRARRGVKEKKVHLKEGEGDGPKRSYLSG